MFLGFLTTHCANNPCTVSCQGTLCTHMYPPISPQIHKLHTNEPNLGTYMLQYIGIRSMVWLMTICSTACFWSSPLPIFWDPSDKGPNHCIFLSSGPATNSPGIGSRIAVLNPKDEHFRSNFHWAMCCWAHPHTLFRTQSHKNCSKHLSHHASKNSCDTYLFLILLLQRNANNELFEPTQLTTDSSQQWFMSLAANFTASKPNL